MKLATLYMLALNLKCLISKIYNKGKKMNIKLKDLLQEEGGIKIKSDSEMDAKSKDPVTPATNSTAAKPAKKKPEDESDKKNIVDDLLIDNKINQARYKMLGRYDKYSKILYSGGKVHFSSSEVSKFLGNITYIWSLDIPAGAYTNLNKQKQDLVYNKIFAKTEKPDTRTTKSFGSPKFSQKIVDLIKTVGWKESQTVRDRVQILYKGKHVINCAKMTIGYGGVPSIGVVNSAKGVGRLRYIYSYYITNDGTEINDTAGMNINELYVQYQKKNYPFTKFVSWTW